jgi:hypothetical protein
MRGIEKEKVALKNLSSKGWVLKLRISFELLLLFEYI